MQRLGTYERDRRIGKDLKTFVRNGVGLLTRQLTVRSRRTNNTGCSMDTKVNPPRGNREDPRTPSAACLRLTFGPAPKEKPSTKGEGDYGENGGAKNASL